METQMENLVQGQSDPNLTAAKNAIIASFMLLIPGAIIFVYFGISFYK